MVKKAEKKSGRAKKEKEPEPYKVAVIRLHGPLASDTSGEENALNWDKFEPLIATAFAWEGCKAVVLDIDSPGGSPAEADMIAQEIRYQAKVHNLPVYAFLRGMATSGGYWLACAADEIYAQRVSDIGSIGVITTGFGYHEMNRKKGIERRIFTAGTRKSQMDPYLPLKKADVKTTKAELQDLHRIFIEWILSRRGDRLKGDVDKLMNGNSWYGDKALKRGLIDGIGFVKTVMAEKAGGPIQYGLFKPEEEKMTLADLFGQSAEEANDNDEPEGRKKGPRHLVLDNRPKPQFR